MWRPCCRGCKTCWPPTPRATPPTGLSVARSCTAQAQRPTAKALSPATRFYLSAEPILNNVPTRVLRRPDDLAYTLAHLEELVVKEVHGAGGYGMLIGPAASRAEIEEFRTRIKANPERYIAQPTLALSACPTFVESGLAPRHIDLRPFVLSGRDVRVVPGGLTRVALREGSLVVNSSQGGGTKDTWVLQT